MAIDPTGAAGSAPQTTTDKARTGLNATFDQFLTMLTTQMKYQDPLSPMDSNQFTQQLVSFSQVEQQLSTNDKLDSLIGLQQTSGMQGALDYLGLKVEAQTPYFSFDGQPVDLAYGFDKAASEVSVNILDPAGAVVATRTGELTAGRHEFSWDGKDANGQTVPAGTYILQVTAKDANGDSLSPWTTFTGIATGVDGSGDTTQVLVGDIPVDTDDILAAWRD